MRRKDHSVNKNTGPDKMYGQTFLRLLELFVKSFHPFMTHGCCSFYFRLMHRIVVFIISLAFCFTLSCEKFNDPSRNYTYSIPDSEQNELLVSSLEAEGMDEVLVTQMTNLIIREEYKWLPL